MCGAASISLITSCGSYIPFYAMTITTDMIGMAMRSYSTKCREKRISSKGFIWGCIVNFERLDLVDALVAKFEPIFSKDIAFRLQFSQPSLLTGANFNKCLPHIQKRGGMSFSDVRHMLF